MLDSAKDDLDAIADYIAQDNPAKAIEWVERLRERAKTLGRFPEKGRPYRGGYRVLVADKGYRIYYRANHERNMVFIAHFLGAKHEYYD